MGAAVFRLVLLLVLHTPSVCVSLKRLLHVTSTRRFCFPCFFRNSVRLAPLSVVHVENVSGRCTKQAFFLFAWILSTVLYCCLKKLWHALSFVRTSFRSPRKLGTPGTKESGRTGGHEPKIALIGHHKPPQHFRRFGDEARKPTQIRWW